MSKLISYLPFDIVNIILQYDGRIKYIHKMNLYINIINTIDIERQINNKINLIRELSIGNNNLKFFIDIYYKNKELGLMFCKKKLE